MSHTPGPWMWDKSYATFLAITDMHRISICDVTCSSQDGVIISPTSIQEANAHLIAAAPELLEALKYARRYMRVDDHDIGYIDRIIAKAEGKS